MSRTEPSAPRRPPPGLRLVFLLAAACGGGGDEGGPGSGGPWSVQLHVHGSFSEGVGSIDSHSHEASDLGVDVIWWSDHDFRIGSYKHVTRFGFERWREPVDAGEAWVSRLDRERFKGPRWKGFRRDPRSPVTAHEAELVAEAPFEGERCLRLAATSAAPTFQLEGWSFVATRDLHIRPLASRVALELAVRPVELGPDARAVVVVGLSEHAPHGELPRAQYALHYVLDRDLREPVRQGSVYTVPLEWRAGEWNRYELRVSADAVEGFPFLHGEDNSLHELVVGVEARNGARAACDWDDLRIVQELSGAAAFERQEELLGEVGGDYPDVRQLRGVEISYTSNHLNEFSESTELLDYDALLAEADRPGSGVETPADFNEFVARRAVEEAHRRGGLVSYNHMFGVSAEEEDDEGRTREELLEALLANRAFGADILEVGYRARGGHPLEDHLWVWDRLALAGLRLVGTGVSDSHGGRGERWRTGRNNFVSWIWADSPAKADLIEGLRAGRVFFGDPARFDGRMELRTEDGRRMGAEVAGARGEVSVSIEVEGCVAGDVVRVVVGGERVASLPVDGPSFRATHRLALPSGRDTLLRVELAAADGTGKAFTNPIWFLASPGAGEGVEDDRGAGG